MRASKEGLRESLFYSFVVAVGAVGLFSFYQYNLVSPAIFELAFFILALSECSKIKLESFVFLICSFGYVFGCGFFSLYVSGDNYLDFFQAFKAFIYVGMISFLVGKNIFDSKRLGAFFFILLIMFFIKYAYSRAFEFTPRMGGRPGLFAENNFELIFLILIFYFCAPMIRMRFLAFLALAVVVFLSGSRSAILALLVVYVFAFMRRFDWRFFGAAAVLGALVSLAVWVYFSRMDGGLESIDRFQFMLVFLSEVEEWPWWKFIFGSPAITPLSVESCQKLAYYSQLFSYSGDGSCYSVILHSYIFRVIFDHGLSGLLYLIVFVWWAIRRNGGRVRDVFCVLGVLMSSALSVSSFNSVFVAMSLGIVVSLRPSTSLRTPVS